jgi:hypothetical protein
LFEFPTASPGGSQLVLAARARCSTYDNIKKAKSNHKEISNTEIYHRSKMPHVGPLDARQRGSYLSGKAKNGLSA